MEGGVILERFKRAIFPVLVLIIIIVALLYRLSSCASAGDGSASTSAASAEANPSAAVSAPVAVSHTPEAAVSPSHEVNYTDDDIVRIFTKEGCKVRDIRDAGSATIVEFYYPDSLGDAVSSFAWFDRETGKYDVVGSGLVVDQVEITPQKTLTVLTTGINYVNGKQWFPEIYRSSFNEGAEAVRYFNETYPYFMPISQSFTVSDDRFESIRSIVIDFDAVSVGFVPQQGHESEFEVAYRYIPKTGLVCSGGFCYVTFYNTTLTSGFMAPTAGDGDGLRSFVSVKSDGMNTLLTLKLGAQAARYNISMDYSPDDGMPYAVLRFRTDGDIYPPYHAGW
jgi:hypothetical protein